MSLIDLHNDMIFTIYQWGFFGARTVDEKLCIGYTYIRRYIPKYIEPMSTRNKIKCRFETCISDMLLWSYLNKWRISQLSKLDKLCFNSASTRILQKSKINFIEFQNQLFPHNSHIHLRACDHASSYHCPPPIM